MNTVILRYSRLIAASLVLLVTAQMSEAAALPVQEQQQAPVKSQPAESQPGEAQPAAQQQTPDAPAPAFAMRSQEPPQDAQQQDAQKPVGTAAGPATRPTGVAGSRPAGAAIAPAKQKRVKAIAISVGLIVAGAVAAGAVVGLSKGSPSRP